MFTSKFRYITLIIGSLFFAIPAAISQTPTPKPNPDDEVIKVESRLVVVPVSVTDADGQAVKGLTEKDFRILEEGRKQVIDHVGNAETVPLEIALLFDVSASTDRMFRFQQETAAAFLRDVMGPKDRASVFTIGEHGALVQSRDTAEKAMASIRAIKPTREATAFYDSIQLAADHLKKNSPQGVRRVMVIISDGEDTNSAGVSKAILNAELKLTGTVEGEKLRDLRVNAREGAKLVEQAKILKALQDADTVFYSINPGGSSYHLNKMSVFGQENMQRFADATGGTAFLPKFLQVEGGDTSQMDSNVRKNQTMLELIFRQLANELRAQYLVEYYSDAKFPMGRFVKLDVALENAGTRHLRARQGYYVKN